MKKFLCMLLAFGMVFAMAACTKSGDNNTSSTDASGDVSGTTSTPGSDVVEFPAGNYTWNTAVNRVPTLWNPHTYQQEDDNFSFAYTDNGLYTFLFNDALHPVEGLAAYSSYVVVPEMAASEPVDVTEQVKKDHPEFNIPANATAGYAYTIDLNQAACWDDGTPINADTYVYSTKKLFDPKLNNYRAADRYTGALSIAGAEAYALQGHTSPTTVSAIMARDGLTTVEEFLAKYGDEKAYVNWNYSFGAIYDPATQTWSEEGFEDEVVQTEIKLSDMLNVFIDMVVNQWEYDEETARSFFMDEAYLGVTYAEGLDWSTVGLYKSGDYQITLVLSKALAGFDLLYNLSSNWIVKEDLYEKGLSENENGTWSNKYGTTLALSASYGPYKITGYQADKEMVLEKNDKWYGWTDDKHVYVDPEDGKTYRMYQTTKIVAQQIQERETRKNMFLKGQLMQYGLGKEDFEQYRNSEYTYASPAETIYFMIVNGHRTSIAAREASEDFDQSKYDLETMTLTSFRQALAITYDRELFAASISPSRTGGYGLIGSEYIYDPATGAKYRDTDQAKRALCKFYSVNLDDYNGDLDKAVAAITGFDPVTAKELLKKAFQEALEANYITDTDNDGKSDQTVRIEYCASEVDQFIQDTVDYMNKRLNEVAEGTPFEGKLEIYVSAPYGDAWVTKIQTGMSDMVLGGWSGGLMDPYGVILNYTDPNRQYDGQWFDSTKKSVTITIDGEELTGSLKAWAEALNGIETNLTKKDGSIASYNFGAGIASVDNRLEILAALEIAVLETYDYLPMLQDGGMSMLSQQVYWVVEEYNSVMLRGGIAYAKYNYNDADWAAYVASQEGGVLKY